MRRSNSSLGKTCKKTFAVFLSMFFIWSMFLPAYGETASKTSKADMIITLTADIGKINVNGTWIKTEKPFVFEKTLYFPLKAVMESLGAEVTESSAVAAIVYRDFSAILKTGSQSFLLNHTVSNLPAAPILKNKRFMVPLEFLKKLVPQGLNVSLKGRQAIIELTDDGAITDLSFLIGSFTQPRAGNSYFGWSINIPKGSRLSSESFNSRDIVIENEQRGITLEISVESNLGMTLEKKYGELLKLSKDLEDETFIDASLQDKGAALPYAEFLFTDQYDEAIYQRIYSNERYFYSVTVTSVDESNPETLRDEKYFKDLSDSFRLGFKGNGKDVADLSRVKSGLAVYDHYIDSPTAGNKISVWSMSIFPEWGNLVLSTDNPYNSAFGLDITKYISIDTISQDGNQSAEAYAQKMIKKYAANFNGDYYKLTDSGSAVTAGFPSYRLVYEVKMGKKLYRYEERFLESDGFIFDITFKTLSGDYSNEAGAYAKMLSTFKPSVSDSQSLAADMEKYGFDQYKNRVAKTDAPAKQENPVNGWSVEVPGYWQQKNYPGQSITAFNNKDTGASVLIETEDNKGISSPLKDEERFTLLKNTVEKNLTLKSSDTEAVRGMSVKRLVYRVDDDETEDYADIVFRIMEKDGYSYCLMSSIPDLCTSERNMTELEAIWNSFALIQRTTAK